MCMKGLVMVHLGEREAGIALIKEGMLKDLQSHICWHVWALVQKGEHNYEEALKSYMRALKIDKDNFNIIRETSILQTHSRQYDALLESRLHMLRLRPYSRVHWVGVALAYKLVGNVAEARRYMDHMEGFLRNVPTRDPEYGELVFFHIRLLEELGEWQEALSLLDRKVKDRMLVDRPAIAECRAKALDILEEFSCKHPKANTHQRLGLTIAKDEKFKELAKPYLARALRKGIPSLFGDVKTLYVDPFKLQSIQEIVEDIRSSVTPKDPSQPSLSSDPTEYLWALYFLAQHYSSLGQYEKSLEILHIAIEHTPTLPELYMTKARVLKRAGDPFGAVRAMEDARRLDGQDRYLNTKSGKYRLRAGMIDEADKILGLFTKKDASPSSDLLEMQALHYLMEAFNHIQKIFNNFREEHYDFHMYSLRISMLSSYLSLLTWEDHLPSHLAYIHAAVSSARVTLFFYATAGYGLQPLVACVLPNRSSLAEASPEVSKKALNKAKKAAHKATAETSKDYDDASSQKGELRHRSISFHAYNITFRFVVRAATKRNEDKGLEAPPSPDDDPEGLKLVTTGDLLERASKFLGSLGEYGKDNIDVNLTSFDVAIRQKKYLKAAQALRRAHTCDRNHPEVHVRVVELARKVASLSDVSELIKSALDESVAAMKSAKVSLDTFNSQYLQRNASCAGAILGSAKVLGILDAPTEEIESLLFTTLNDNVRLCHEDAQGILCHLQQIRSRRADEFRIACDGKFTLSKMFKSAEEQDGIKQHCVDPRDENEVETVF
ncbi:N-terminal acetyltransferase A, auxiliary subunit, partial [Butyriboletus roseoflavus]